MFLGLGPWSDVPWTRPMVRCSLDSAHGHMFLGLGPQSDVPWTRPMVRCSLDSAHGQMFLGLSPWSDVSWIPKNQMFLGSCSLDPITSDVPWSFPLSLCESESGPFIRQGPDAPVMLHRDVPDTVHTTPNPSRQLPVSS